jgi:hypothetical protein
MLGYFCPNYNERDHINQIQIRLERIFQIQVNFGLLIFLVLIMVPSGLMSAIVHTNYPNLAS